MSRLVEVDELGDALSCAVCMEPFQRASCFPCGHSLCGACAEECINVKHQCPLCKQPATTADLRRNLALQSLVDAISEAANEQQSKYFAALQTTALQSDQLDPELRQHFSPIETIFANALRTSFVQYQELFRRLTRKLDCATRNAESLPELERTAAIDAAQREFRISMQLLEKDCERFVAATTVSPFLLASTVTVSCPPRNAHFNMQVDSLTVPSAVLDAVRKHFNSKGPASELKSFHEPVELCLVKQDGHVTIPIDTTSPRPLGDYVEDGRIDSTWSVVLQSDVALANDMPDGCFAQMFGTAAQPASVDYFSCKDCGINWVCASCAKTCHSGHTLRTHILGHVPTWACCYCFKKHSKSHCRYAQATAGPSDGESKTG